MSDQAVVEEQVTIAGASTNQIDSDQVAGFYYLSSINSDEIADKAYNEVQSKIRYFPDSYRQWYDWYLEYYRNYDQFPSWEKFQEASTFTTKPTYDFKQAGELFSKQMALWESDFLADQMKTMPLKERRELVQRMSKTLENNVEEDEPLHSLSTFQAEEFIQPEVNKDVKFKFPIQRLNELTIINPGNMITVLAPPGSFKTGFSLNSVYMNSVAGGLNSLYIYLENKESAYQAELRARHSFSNGMRIENSSLKRGVLKEDKAALDRIHALCDDLEKSKKGQVYFVPFNKFNPEPLRFGNQLAKYVRDYKIGFVVFDYLQAAKSFTPLKWDRREYLNELCSSFRTACLGMFDCDPFVGMMLAQLKREAEERLLKTRGNSATLYDAAEVSSIERDSFVALSLYADAEMKAANTLTYKILKNRDEMADINSTQTTVIPQYCFIGDENADAVETQFDMGAVDDAFDMDLDL